MNMITGMNKNIERTSVLEIAMDMARQFGSLLPRKKEQSMSPVADRQQPTANSLEGSRKSQQNRTNRMRNKQSRRRR